MGGTAGGDITTRLLDWGMAHQSEAGILLVAVLVVAPAAIWLGLRLVLRFFRDRAEAEAIGKAVGEAKGKAATAPTPPPSPPIVQSSRVEIHHLPQGGREFVGRDADMDWLRAAWKDDRNVVTIVAPGGVGKSMLVGRWMQELADDDWGGAEKVFAWSFYSQGAGDRQASADEFAARALTFFGDDGPPAPDPWSTAERLAAAIQKQKALLVLDGMEPLQYPPGVMDGATRDPIVQRLLELLAWSNPGLCVVTTRERVKELETFEDGSAPKLDLHTLSPEDGAKLLARLGVDGDDQERAKIAKEFGGHALALVLLGTYLREAHGGDLRKAREVALLRADANKDGHADRVMRSYFKWLSDRERAVLALVGLFDRPAKGELVALLRSKPAIRGVTKALVGLSSDQWATTLTRLRGLGLLLPADCADRDGLDAHPLVREFAAARLRTEAPKGWRQAHERLYRHLCDTTEHQPDTLAGLAPLYQAVHHGCAAGLWKETLYGLLEKRIWRGRNGYTIKNLGAFGSDLSALAEFFVAPWTMVVQDLQYEHASLLNKAGFILSAIGRRREGITATTAALKLCEAKEIWGEARANAANLAGAALRGGDLKTAFEMAKKGGEHAQREKDIFDRYASLVCLAYVELACGNCGAAAEKFAEAKHLLHLERPGMPFFFSVAAFQYCELLLDKGDWRQAKELTKVGLSVARNERHGRAMDIANHTLMLARAAQQAGEPAANINNLFNEAIIGLRRAGHHDYLCNGLIARANWHRQQRQWDKAEADLAEARRIAVRSEARLYLTDIEWETARLRLAQGRVDEAARHFAIGRDMVAEIGYHRRDGEVAELAEKLGLMVPA